MARALTMACFVGLNLCAGLSSWALGPAAPFEPPAPQAASDAAPAQGAVKASGLAGIKFGHQPQALIDGAWVARGATVRDDALVLSIERQAVQLKHADGRVERLVLSPDVQMNKSSAHASTSRRMP
ncbi:MAG: hypothetical protein EOP38_00415 [Rubrivivax sp.]|nr:MAG: hypothetical protein EOP38_00415 [Rubrivivax sp.]